MQTPDKDLYDALCAAKHPGDRAKAQLRYYAHADENAAHLLKRLKNTSLACNAGCSHCCYQRVGVLAHEVFVITDFVSDKFSPQQKQILIERLKDYVERIRKMSVADRERRSIACPFLIEGRCSIYRARPANCRSCHSIDRAPCMKQEETGIPQPFMVSETLMDVWNSMIKACDYQYFRLGYDQQSYELGSSCLAAFDKSVHRKRWSQGKSSLLPDGC